MATKAKLRQLAADLPNEEDLFRSGLVADGVAGQLNEIRAVCRKMVRILKASLEELDAKEDHNRRLTERLAFADETLAYVAGQRKRLNGSGAVDWHVGSARSTQAEEYLGTRG